MCLFRSHSVVGAVSRVGDPAAATEVHFTQTRLLHWLHSMTTITDIIVIIRTDYHRKWSKGIKKICGYSSKKGQSSSSFHWSFQHENILLMYFIIFWRVNWSEHRLRWTSMMKVRSFYWASICGLRIRSCRYSLQRERCLYLAYTNEGLFPKIEMCVEVLLASSDHWPDKVLLRLLQCYFLIEDILFEISKELGWESLQTSRFRKRLDIHQTFCENHHSRPLCLVHSRHATTSS